jgi:ABC-type glycerol-3-phosphate transport system substrate-binding protein
MKRNRQRLLAVGVTALLLAGCSTTGGGTTSGASQDPGVQDWATSVKEKYNGTSITIAAQTHPSTAAMQAMTADFTALTGIEVRWDIVDQNSLKQKIELDYQSGNAAYDAVMVDGFWMSSFAERGIVADVSQRLNSAPDFFDYKDILPAYSEGLQEVDGKSYGVQIAGETRFIGYRKDLFDKYGKKPPTTMKEDLELAQFFTGKEDGLYGTSMRAQKGIHFASGLLTLMYQFSTGFWDPKTGADQIASPENVQALQYYLDLLKTMPKDVGSYTHEEALSAFTSGHSAMWFDATAIAPTILNPDSSVVADKVAFVPPPSGPRGQYGALAGWGLSLASKAKNADAAWAFITYMTSKAKAAEYTHNGGVPTRTSTLANPQTDQEKVTYPAMLESLDKAKNLSDEGISWLPKVEQLDEKLTIIGNYCSEAFVGNLTAKEALERASAEIKSL